MVSNVIMIRKYRRNNRINKKGDKINVWVTCKLGLSFFLSLTDIFFFRNKLISKHTHLITLFYQTQTHYLAQSTITKRPFFMVSILR